MKEKQPEFHKPGQNRGEAERRELLKWQSRLKSAGSLEKFLSRWAPHVEVLDVEIPQTCNREHAKFPIEKLVGAIQL